MAHGQFHHNRGSLRRFIRTEAGMESFPYTAAYPLDYGARYHAYNGFFQNLFGGGQAAAEGAGAVAEGAAAATGEAAAKGAVKPGGFFTGMGSSLVDVAGGILGGVFTNKANANAQEASLASNERIAALKIAADRDAAIAIAAQQQQSAGGMSGGTIALILGGVAVVGTVGYFVLRKKK
jgi:hypothetical protein